MMKRVILAAALWSLLPSLGLAQTVRQSGTVTPGHVTVWETNGVVKDGGTAASGALTSLGVTNNGGPGICINSAAVTGPYNQLCLSVSTSGAAAVTLQNYGGASAQELNFILNGTTYSFPFVLSGIVGPGTTTVGQLACWNNTTGTLLKECGDPTTITAGPGIQVSGSAGAYTVSLRIQTDKLSVTSTNTLSALSATYAGTFFLLIVNGQTLNTVGASPPFTVSGTAVTWSAANAGYNLETTDSVVAVYSR